MICLNRGKREKIKNREEKNNVIVYETDRLTADHSSFVCGDHGNDHLARNTAQSGC